VTPVRSAPTTTVSPDEPVRAFKGSQVDCTRPAAEGAVTPRFPSEIGHAE